VVEEGLIGVEDWYATFCALAGVDPEDARAAAAGLPPIDSLDLWPLLSGQNATSPRQEVVLGQPLVSGDNSIGDPWQGVQALIRADGYKLVLGTTHQNVWTSPQYPNASTSWKNDAADCTAGCLYNVFTDPTEHADISASHPDIVAALKARIIFHNNTMYRPNRGTSDQKYACGVLVNTYGGFWGPWRDL
jgi:arylsulfatase I/J